MEPFEDPSYMSPSGYHASTCGYCHSKPRQSSRSYYAFSDVHTVHPTHYQKLVDHGWRRSGTTWYKPDVRNACCPHYTIRLPARQFKPRKDQRRAVGQFTNFVLGQEYKRKAARLCPISRQEKKVRRNHFDLYHSVHASEYGTVKRPLDPAEKKPIEPAHKLEVTLEPDEYSEEKYALFAHYQKLVHKEPPSKISRSGFRSFLCSGMQQSEYTLDGEHRKIGSFHQCYRLDGRLIAIGVLDLLPLAVSSVYLIYHDDVSQWEFGKLSALREIALAAEGGYEYYYMGYYIHNCVKMKYKRTFSPTYVLDPESYGWDPLDDTVAARMSARKYVSLSRERQLGLSAPTREELEALPPAHDVASAGVDAGLLSASVFEADMPGVLTRSEVESQISLEDVQVRQRGASFNLGGFGSWGIRDPDRRSPLLFIAEFVACIGPELAAEIVVDLG